MDRIGKLFSGVRAAIFDADGTLVDSMPMWHGIDVVYAERKGLLLTPEMSRDLYTLTLPACARYIREKCGVQESEDEIVREIVELAAEGYANDVPEIPGAEALLSALSARGMPCAVATASDLASLMPALERLGLMRRLAFAESCDRIGAGKDRPDLYLHCAERLGVRPEECAVFEDARYAMETAKAAGFRTVAVLFGECDPAERAAMTALADLAVEDLTGLARAVSEMKGKAYVQKV